VEGINMENRLFAQNSNIEQNLRENRCHNICLALPTEGEDQIYSTGKTIIGTCSYHAAYTWLSHCLLLS
jgi:hypothetical protein